MGNELTPAPWQAQVGQAPDSAGVYLFKNSQGEVIYVGKARHLKKRLQQYLQGRSHGPFADELWQQAHEVETIESPTEVEALLMENRLIKDLNPRFNVLLKDGKSFPYLEITLADDFPLIQVSRDNHRPGHEYFGPFVSASSLRQALSALQKVFRFRTCTMAIDPKDQRRRYFRPCLLHAIDRCTAPCADRISRTDYRKDITRLKRFLNGGRQAVMEGLQKDMDELSKQMRYEEAALIRDQMNALNDLDRHGDLGQQPEIEIAPLNPEEGLQELADKLKLDFVPRSIEGIDIAHLQGEATTACTVVFLDGHPLKEAYRHYHIKTVEGIDDPASIAEVVRRRLSRLIDEGEALPHLLLLDGGLGVLNAALHEVRQLGLEGSLTLLALAKKEELLYVEGRDRPLRLSRHGKALRLLQHVRDEAHRFCRRLHHKTRHKDWTSD